MYRECNVLELFRKNAGLTREELGLRLGFKQNSAYSTIYQFETGMRVVPEDKIPAYAEALGVSEETVRKTGGKKNPPLPAEPTLKDYRLSAGLSRQKFGELMGYPSDSAAQTISVLEKNKKVISRDKIPLAANALGVSTEEIQKLNIRRGGLDPDGTGLEELRRAAGLTQEELGIMVGYSKSSARQNIFLAEQGKTEIAEEKISLYADALGVSEEKIKAIIIKRREEIIARNIEKKKDLMPDYEHTVGCNIMKRRIIAGLKQSELDRKAGFPKTTVFNIENNRRKTTVCMIDRIAAILGCSAEDLIAGDTAQPRKLQATAPQTEPVQPACCSFSGTVDRHLSEPAKMYPADVCGTITINFYANITYGDGTVGGNIQIGTCRIENSENPA